MARKVKKNKQFVVSHALKHGAPLLFGTLILALAIFIRPAPAAQHVNTTVYPAKKVISHPKPPPPKVVQPAPPLPTPAASPPQAAPKPTPAKATTPHGTPKVEPVVTPSPGSDVSGLTPTTPPAAPPSGGSGSSPSSQQTTTGYYSYNWSGYMATAGSFTGISGSWIATNPTGNGSTITADSTWIGIGGVTSNDLIQVGTQNIISASGQVSTSAFYEMLPDISQPVPGMTVTPGDSMSASVTQISSGQWVISITDNTNSQTWSSNFAYASTLSSAEWVEEDPSFASGRLIPFDNFQQATFSGGSTVANGSSVSIAASTAQPVTMVNRAGQTIAAPSAISGGASFTVSP